MKDVLDLVTRPLAADLRAAIEARYEEELMQLSEEWATSLSPEERQGAVFQCLITALNKNDVFSAPYGEDGLPKSLAWCLCYSLDWKDANGVEWRSRAIARQLGLPLTFEYVPDSITDVAKGLSLADAWFRPFGYALLDIDKGGDSYIALPLRVEWIDEAERQVQAAGFTTARYRYNENKL